MECTVSWTGGSGARSAMGFLAETGTGHALMMDGAPDAARPELGGQNLAPRPMELLLAGTGGCTAPVLMRRTRLLPLSTMRTLHVFDLSVLPLVAVAV